MTTAYLKSILGNSIKSFKAPSESQLLKFKAFVDDKTGKFADVTRKVNSDYHFNLFNIIFSSWSIDKSLSSLQLKDFRKIPLVLNLEFKGHTPLIALPGFLESYLHNLSFNKDDRSSRKLYKTMLRNYRSYKPYIETILNTIRPLILSSKNILCALLQERHSRYQILSHDISDRIAEVVLLPALPNESARPVDHILKDVGIGADLRESGITEDVGIKILAQCKRSLAHGNELTLNRTFEYFINPTQKNKLYHDYLLNEIIDALLGNYTFADPGSSIKEKISRFIDQYFGDPRGNPRWNTVPIEQRKVIIRWKVGVTLSAFFKLLDDVAKEDDLHAKHWKMRKAFWKDLLENENITQAWIVLGSKYLERKDLYLKDDLGFAKFSTHDGIERSHCAIILEVSGYIITEWSHNGATRVFDHDDKSAPSFYENKYHPQDLKNLSSRTKGVGGHNSGYIPHSQNWENKMRLKLGLEKRIRR